MLLAAGSGVGFLTGLFGVGGGFVIIPVLTLLMHFAMPEAIGTSLLVVAINSAVALLARLGSAHIDWGVATAFTVTAVIGAQGGSQVASRLDPRLRRRAGPARALYRGAGAGGRGVSGP